MAETLEGFAQRLRELRKGRNLSQTELGRPSHRLRRTRRSDRLGGSQASAAPGRPSGNHPGLTTTSLPHSSQRSNRRCGAPKP